MALRVKQILLKSAVVVGLLVGLSGCVSLRLVEESNLSTGFRRWTAADALRVLYSLDKHSMTPASTFHPMELTSIKRRAVLISLSAAFKHVGLAEAQARGASARYTDGPEPKHIKIGIIDDFNEPGSHGEEVASFALAAAPDAEVWTCNVGEFESGVAERINYCLTGALAKEFDVINLSFGLPSTIGDTLNFLCTAVPIWDDFRRKLFESAQLIERLRQKGTIIVGAAGNDGKHRETFFPGCRGDISAGAVYGDFYESVPDCEEFNVQPDDVTCFSNYGNLFAPGYFVLADGEKLPGTSFASPLIAGAAALIKAR